MASEYGDFCRAQREERSEKNAARAKRNEKELLDVARNIADVKLLPPAALDGPDYWTIAFHKIEARFWASTGTTQFRLADGRLEQKYRHYDVRPLVRELRRRHLDSTTQNSKLSHGDSK